MSKNIFFQKNFLPFFITQFLGAFNDNIFKNTLIIMLTYQVVKDSSLLVNISALLFILPFFLFSAIGGQLGDKLEKSAFIRKVKLAEIGIMLIGALCFMFDVTYGLMAVLFLMGTQSAFFGPVKYSILPQHLAKDQLLKGNAYVESGTFVAILLGTIFAGFIIQFDELSKYYIGAAVLVFAVLGYLASLFIPPGLSNNPTLKVNYNIFSETMSMMKRLKEQRISVSRSILAISWFWFFGAVFMTQFPVYTKEFLHSNESVVILLLTLFSVGIAIGSVLSEKLSAGDVELGLVPVGAIGLTVGGVCLYFATLSLNTPDASMLGAEGLLTAKRFISADNAWQVIASVLTIGMFGGFYTVPLYTLIQLRTEEQERSRVIAINNIMNALFMVASAIYSIFMLRYFSVLELLLSMAIINIAVSAYIFTVVPEFAMRFIVMMILKCTYRIKKENLNLPKEGAVVVVSNHVSFMDALILSAAIQRPMRFVMYYKIFNIPLMSFVFRQLKVIPIAGFKEDKQVFTQAFDDIASALENGEVVFIFPEGQLTLDGNIATFKSGIEKIIERSPTPVYTVALQGLWGSLFSKSAGKAKRKRIYSRVTVVGGELIPAAEVTRHHLEQKVRELAGDLK